MIGLIFAGDLMDEFQVPKIKRSVLSFINFFFVRIELRCIFKDPRIIYLVANSIKPQRKLGNELGCSFFNIGKKSSLY